MYSPNEALDNLYLLKEEKYKELREMIDKKSFSVTHFRRRMRELTRLENDIKNLEYYLEHDAKNEI